MSSATAAVKAMSGVKISQFTMTSYRRWAGA